MSSLQALQIKLARIDPNAFVEYCFSDERGILFEQQDFHVQWQNAISANKNVLIEGPREHGKTEQIIARSIFEMGKNPNVRIKLLCNTDEEASKRVTAIGHHIRYNSRIREVFPNLRPGNNRAWTQHKIFVARSMIAKDGSLEAHGILSTGTGGRSDILIGDDVVDFRNAIQQPALRQMVKYAWDNVWMNTLHPEGHVIYICTPWHMDDLSQILKTRKSFTHIRHVIDNEHTPIWPSKWSREKLLARLADIGTGAYARGFQCRAISDDDMIFGSIENCLDYGLIVSDIPGDWPCYGGVDLAIGKGNDSARSVIITLAVNPNTRQKYLKEIRSGRWSSPDTARQAIAAFQQHKHRIMFVENNAYQEAFVQWLAEMDDTGLRHHVKSFTTGKNKADDTIGLPGMAVEVENHAFVLPHGGRAYTPDCLCEVCELIKEMKYYPAQFKDRVMALWFANEAARGFGEKIEVSSSGEREVRKELLGKSRISVRQEVRDYA